MLSDCRMKLSKNSGSFKYGKNIMHSSDQRYQIYKKEIYVTWIANSLKENFIYRMKCFITLINK